MRAQTMKIFPHPILRLRKPLLPAFAVCAALLCHCADSDAERIAEFEGANVRLNNVKNLLETAVWGGNAETVRALIEAGINISEHRHEKFNPVVIAVRNGYAELLKTLLANGADAREKDETGETLLIRAAMGNNLEILEILLATGKFDVNAISNGPGWTALMLAARHGNVEMAKRLLAAGADPGIQGNDGKTALDTAREYNATELFPLFNAE